MEGLYINIFLNAQFGGNMIGNKNLDKGEGRKAKAGTINGILFGKTKAQSCYHDLSSSEE